MMDYGAEAIKRHRESRGKVSIASKMRVETLEDLSIAYTPGVASVCMAIHADRSSRSSSPTAATPLPWSPTARRCWAWATSAPRRLCR